jgi:hypothetical protein
MIHTYVRLSFAVVVPGQVHEERKNDVEQQWARSFVWSGVCHFREDMLYVLCERLVVVDGIHVNKIYSSLPVGKTVTVYLWCWSHP